MTLTRRTHCQDHNGLVHIASRLARVAVSTPSSNAPAAGLTHAFTLCGRDMPISSYWTAGASGAPATLVTCSRCLAEANQGNSKPRAWGDLFDLADAEKGNIQ